MYYDLAAGRRLELEVLTFTVIRLGRKYGIPTPHELCHLCSAEAIRRRGTHHAMIVRGFAVNIAAFVAATLFGASVVATRVTGHEIPPLGLAVL